jgi:hypothetical protein
MIDKMLERLMERDRPGDLTHLERDLWHREFRQRATRQTNLTLASWQAGIIAIAMFGSATIGIAAAAHVRTTSHLLASGEELAPSTLLFGNHP